MGDPWRCLTCGMGREECLAADDHVWEPSLPPFETADRVAWTMPREDARDLLRWLRHNRPLGMPDRTFDGLVDALATRILPPGGGRSG